jgi:quinoprotein glucose dehydrogenase
MRICRNVVIVSVFTSATLLGAACSPREVATPAEDVKPPVGWPGYAGDAGSMRYSPLDDIGINNVGKLEPVWTWHADERDTIAPLTGEHVRAGKFEATPLAFGDTLYFSTSFNRVIAIDGRTGREIWSFDPQVQLDGLIADDRAGFVHRGVASGLRDGRRTIFHASRGWLYALDGETGLPVIAFGDSGKVDLIADLRWSVQRSHIGNTSPPAVYNNVVIVGSAIGDRLIFDRDPPGDVQAFDVHTGRRIWRWDPVPAVGTPERATWEGESADKTGHSNVWAPITIDTENGLVFLPVSGPSNDFYGGKRLGDNLYSQSLVCLDAETGTLRWAQQLIHHDLWDFDLASPPVLTSTERNGVREDDVLLAGKTGYLYAFERTSGRPVWPMAEVPVPASTVPGERAATTQPHPSLPRPFARQGFSESDVIDFTPALHEDAMAVVNAFHMGPMFTPATLAGTIQLPGWIGGAGWGSTAVDPVRHLAFIKASNLPIVARVRSTGDERGFVSAEFIDPAKVLTVELNDRRWWAWPRVPNERLPIIKPPYGTLTAIDLETGQHVWSITLGDLPHLRNHPVLRDLHLPRLGVDGAPGGMATASGLIFITGGGNVLYAIESATGRELWSHDLEQIGYSNPMTYRATDGRQYVVVATGDGSGATLQAFALPASH